MSLRSTLSNVWHRFQGKRCTNAEFCKSLQFSSSSAANNRNPIRPRQCRLSAQTVGASCRQPRAGLVSTCPFPQCSSPRAARCGHRKTMQSRRGVLRARRAPPARSAGSFPSRHDCRHKQICPLPTAERRRDFRQPRPCTFPRARQRKRFRTILTKGRRELPKPPPRAKGKRGRVARSDAENLHAALKRHEAEILRFARSPEVPFTSNRAERDIRMAKLKQKVSGCFRAPKHADAWCRISSCLKSMGCKGCNPMTAIQVALMSKAAETV